MGLYNFYWKRLPKPLGKGKCLLCDCGMLPVDRNPGRDAFQYICANCNPNVVIGISGSLLASGLFSRLSSDEEVKNILHQEVGQTDQEEFVLDTLRVNKLLLSRV